MSLFASCTPKHNCHQFFLQNTNGNRMSNFLTESLWCSVAFLQGNRQISEGRGRDLSEMSLGCRAAAVEHLRANPRRHSLWSASIATFGCSTLQLTSCWQVHQWSRLDSSCANTFRPKWFWTDCLPCCVKQKWETTRGHCCLMRFLWVHCCWVYAALGPSLRAIS